MTSTTTTAAKPSTRLIRGAFQLLGSTILIKLLGVFFVIPLQRIVKLEGMSMYNHAYPIYAAALQISAAGIPLALSKLIAERLSEQDHKGAAALYRTGSRILSITGVVAFIILVSGAHVIASWQHDPGAALSIMVLAVSLLIAPRLAAMRGLLQGYQYMGHSSTAQVWEQVVRMITIILGSWLIYYYTHNISWAVAVATGGAVTGAVAAWFSLKWSLRTVGIDTEAGAAKPIKGLGRIIVATSIPLSLASLVLPLSQAVDSFSVTALLELGGYANKQANDLYAIFSGATRVVNLPLAFATAIGLPCVPAIAQAVKLKDAKTVNQQVNLVMRFTTILTMPAAVVFIVLAKPIDLIFNKTTTGWPVFSAISLMAVFASIEMTTTYVLQASGKLLRPVRNMMLGLAVKLILNILLIPLWGLVGGATGTVIGYIVSSILNLLAVRKYTGARFQNSLIFIRPLLACIPMGVVMYLVDIGFIHLVAPHLFKVLSTVGELGLVCLAGGYTYLIVGRLIGVLTETELQRMAILNRLLPRALRVL